ncbi:hypothetical protein Abr02nite_48980 [Paractinoplanes brasiliensis]|nr:hypothetical protein Abr02nite_48980 [Actinoplanes brasiliensis]
MISIDRATWTWTVRRQTTPGPGGLIDKGTKGERARKVPIIEDGPPDGDRAARLGGRSGARRGDTSYSDCMRTVGTLHESAIMHNEKMADSRDMIGAHDAIRREFGALAALARGVAAGDARATATIADHIALMIDFLHAHHTSEDIHVWPKLQQRCPAAAEPIVARMAGQHQFIDTELKALSETTRRWRATAHASDRDAVADIAERVVPPLQEHLAQEEGEVLPLVDAYLTDREWKAMIAASLGKVPMSKRPMMMGMAVYQAREEQIELLRTSVPAIAWHVFRPLGERAYHRYRQRLASASNHS